MSRYRVEFTNKETGQQFNVPIGSVSVLGSYENELGDQVTLVKVDGKVIEVGATYDSICFEFKERGYMIEPQYTYRDSHRAKNETDEQKSTKEHH